MEVIVRHEEEVIIIKPIGELIGPDSREFRNMMAEQLANVSESTHFLFDFADVSIMDSTALGVLMGLHQLMMYQSGQIVLVNLGPKLKTLLARAKLTDVFESFQNEAEALASLLQPPNSL